MVYFQEVLLYYAIQNNLLVVVIRKYKAIHFLEIFLKCYLQSFKGSTMEQCYGVSSCVP